MAEGFAKKLGGDKLEVWSAGSKPSGKINPLAIAYMKEKGISLETHVSIGLDDLPSGEWDHVITMGCGDACPLYPGVRYIDWPIDDPQGRPLSAVRRVRDDIERRVRALLDELCVAVAAPAEPAAGEQR